MILGLVAFFVLALAMSVGLYAVCVYADRVRQENIQNWTPHPLSEFTQISQVMDRAGRERTVLWWAPGHSNAGKILGDIERLRTKIVMASPADAQANFEEVERRQELFTQRAMQKPGDVGHPRVSALRSVYSDLVEKRL